jgi:hypothetical protein
MYGFYGWGGAIVIFQIFCIVHAVRNGRAGTWIWIILLFPFIGCIAYIASEVRGGRVGRGGGGRKLANQLVNIVQPSRKLEALRAEVDACPSVENRIALAEECMRHKLYEEALRLYDAASSGVHHDDPEVLRGRAIAQFEMGNHADAKATLEYLFDKRPRDKSAALRLLYARVVEAAGDTEATVQAYEAACTGALGDEARCLYAGALENAGRVDEATAIYTRIVKESARTTPTYRRENGEWIRIAKTKIESGKLASSKPQPTVPSSPL